MRVFAVVLVAACGGQASAPPVAPAPIAPAAKPAALRSPHTPLLVQVPTGWTDLLAASRDEVEHVQPGLWDHARELAARDGYVTLAMPLDAASPDRGSQMTMLAAGRRGPVDARFVDAFLADNNLGLTAADVVERKLLDLGGRPVAKIRAEYQGAQMKIDTLTYLFPDDTGTIDQLVFTVRAERYAALQPALEAIERGAPRGP